ncbi:MAG: hypothetical protein ABI205_09735, partial [Gemmatimonadaceae bacterium]
VVLMDNDAAPKGYAYLLVTDGYGCLCTMLFDDFPSVHRRLDYARQLLTSRYGVAIRNPRPVGGVGHFALRRAFHDDRALHVGEAAGLQDFLWGFGIRSAIRSGVAAAQCLIDGTDWNREAATQFGPMLEASVVNRFLFEKLSVGRYALLMRVFQLGGPGPLLRALSGANRMHRLLLPAARSYVRRRYPTLEI